MASCPADPDHHSRRVMVTGNSGSGKSTVGRALATRLGLPLTHLDQVFWNAGWMPSTPETMRERVAPLAAADAWVIEGNYSGTYDLRVPRADLIVLLDLPRSVTLPSILRRWWRYRGRTRPDLPPGCPDRLSWELLSWSWRWPSRGRPKLLRAVAEAGMEDRLLRFTRRRDVRRWLASVGLP